MHGNSNIKFFNEDYLGNHKQYYFAMEHAVKMLCSAVQFLVNSCLRRTLQMIACERTDDKKEFNSMVKTTEHVIAILRETLA